MADNDTLPATGDVIRSVQKGGGTGPKSQVMVLDKGGGGTEALLAAGQSNMSGSLPVVIASDQSGIPLDAATLAALETITANQGGAASPTAPWPILITDSINLAGVTAANALKVDGSAVTQPVSLAALPSLTVYNADAEGESGRGAVPVNSRSLADSLDVLAEILLRIELHLQRTLSN